MRGQFETYEEQFRKSNLACSDELLSRLIRFHGEEHAAPVVEEEPPVKESVPEAIQILPDVDPRWIKFIDELPGPRNPTIREIKLCVCQHFKLTLAEMDSQQRGAKVSRPRLIAYYLAKKLTGRTLPEIGRKFNRDHTSILSGVRKIAGLVESDPNVAAVVKELEAQFQ